jgi:hypothetical protein
MSPSLPSTPTLVVLPCRVGFRRCASEGRAHRVLMVGGFRLLACARIHAGMGRYQYRAEGDTPSLSQLGGEGYPK